MKVLITGGAGFIGSHLAEEHLKRGDEVVILDDFSVGKHAYVERADWLGKVSIIEGDVRDHHVIERLTRDVDGIHHLAAVVGVQKFIGDPAGCMDANIMGVRSVCERAAKRRIKIVFASSSEIYGEPPSCAIREDEPVSFGHGRRWSYAISKLAGEVIVRGVSSAGIPAVSARLFNVVGPRQEPGYCMSTFVAKAKIARRIEVHGDGEQRRTLAFVGDVAWGLAEMMHSKKVSAGEWNLGGDINISMKDLAAAVFETVGTLGKDKNRVQFVPYEKKFRTDPQDPKYRKCDCSKLAAAIGWKPETTLQYMINETLKEQLRPVGA